MTVQLLYPAHERGLPDLKRLRSRATRVLRELACSRAELSISLVDDAEMKDLNRGHRGLSRPTDVLSFSLLEGEHAQHRGAMLGDVVISFETAKRQARYAHRGYDDEIARLLIHGTLHLLGFDHQVDTDAREMRAEERRIWRALRT